MIGGGDWSKDRLIPDIFKSFKEKNPVIIRYPNAIRPWQHVLEPLSGYMLLIEHLYLHGNDFASSWNFDHLNELKTVKEITKYLIEK